MGGKKLLVLSDSHGSVSALTAVLDWANAFIPPNGTICAAACCGDGIADLRAAAEATGFYSDWKTVLGNNDYGVQAPEAAVFDFADHRFFMAHGHRYGLYSGYHNILAAAKNSDADIALFGHSHIPFYKVINGITLINPGSVARPRSRVGASFAVIECPEGEAIKVEFFSLGARGAVKPIKI
jgi:putative phosphoesterase